MQNYNATDVGAPFRRVSKFEVDYGDAQTGNIVTVTVEDNLAVKLSTGEVLTLPNSKRSFKRFYPLTDFTLWTSPIGMVSNVTGEAKVDGSGNQIMTTRLATLQHTLAVIRAEQVIEDALEDPIVSTTPPLVSGTA